MSLKNYKESSYTIDMENIKIVNGNDTEFYILDYYDGIKEEVNLEEKILLLWNNYEEEYESWFYIKVHEKKILEDYLSDKLGILTLMKNSDIFISKRFYKNYNSISVLDKIDLNNKEVVFPEDDIFIGNNILDYIDSKINIQVIEKYKKKMMINQEHTVCVANQITSNYMLAA